jgi:subtilisin family serine protease
MTTNALVTQPNAPWGLASISSRTRGATNYLYDSSSGLGTFSYVVDTGIRTTHQEFSGRAQFGFNAVGGDNSDNQGHGTHVAGTIGGTTYGVAKRTTLIAVKVFEGREGSASTVLAGFDWAVNDITSKGRQNSAVVNLSLGGPGSTVWDNAITSAWARGVLSVVAAGNENQLASNRSPARSPEALCVGNVQSNDARRSGPTGSNFGPAVDIFAAGTGIVSAYFNSDSATATLTGTSMAAPHVAGLVSYLRGLEGGMSARSVRERVLGLATEGRVTDAQGSANLLAFNGGGG